MRNVDGALLFGNDASVELQRHFYDARQVRWYDVAGLLGYMSHDWLPIAVIVTLWIHDRRHRFRTRLWGRVLGFASAVIDRPHAPGMPTHPAVDDGAVRVRSPRP